MASVRDVTSGAALMKIPGRLIFIGGSEQLKTHSLQIILVFLISVKG